LPKLNDILVWIALRKAIVARFVFFPHVSVMLVSSREESTKLFNRFPGARGISGSRLP
jgi:hypothetical protein